MPYNFKLCPGCPQSSSPCSGRIFMKLQSISRICSRQGIQLPAPVTWISSLPLQVVHSLSELLQPPARPRLKELLRSSTLFSTTLPGIQGNSPVPGAPEELAGVNLICFLKPGDGGETLHSVWKQFNYPQGTAGVISPLLDGPEGSSYPPSTSDSTPVPNSSFHLGAEWFLPEVCGLTAYSLENSARSSKFYPIVSNKAAT